MLQLLSRHGVEYVMHHKGNMKNVMKNSTYVAQAAMTERSWHVIPIIAQ